jgi:hypothetical protein
MPKLTALGIPCPKNSGLSDDELTLRYRAWFCLYHRSRIVRHWFALHDWQTAWPEGGSPITRCTWCGKYRSNA